MTYFAEQQVSLIVVDFDDGKSQEITPSKHQPDHPEFSCIDMLKAVAQVELGRRNHLINKTRVSKHKAIIYRNATSGHQLGFMISSHGKLIPHWEAQLVIRLIAYLRDEKDMSWGELAKHLDYLYQKPGRQFPKISKARIPWSKAMCYKGYIAWKNIQKDRKYANDLR